MPFDCEVVVSVLMFFPIGNGFRGGSTTFYTVSSPFGDENPYLIMQTDQLPLS